MLAVLNAHNLNMNHSSSLPTPLPDFAAFIGMDWGDQTHAVSLCAAGTSVIERTTLQQTPEALAQWANQLRTRFPDRKIALAIEECRGGLLSGLMQYEHIVLFPINPKCLARFREALFPNAPKDDVGDADLALEILLKHPNHLRPWLPDTVQTRQLALVNEQRRHFVDHRTGLTNELTSHLKAIFPQALQLLGQDLASAMATDFLKKWPTLQAVQKAPAHQLRQFYYGHNSRASKLMTQRLELVANAMALTNDPALLSAHSLAIQTLAAQLAALRPFIDQYDQQIAQLFAAHPDAPIFQTLPGAGPLLAPRLLASLGTDRTRFANPQALSCYSGIAPVTEQSGKSQRWVHVRWSCPKFLRQSWHEFANCSIRFSSWARTCYDEFRRRMDHHEAIRKLAFKWQRIIWRMWQQRQPYDEARYVASLQNKGHKLFPAPTNPSEQKTQNPLTD